jgi:hypothetical protein
MWKGMMASLLSVEDPVAPRKTRTRCDPRIDNETALWSVQAYG